VVQTGYNNSATQTQEYEFNTASISQFGSYNVATQVQAPDNSDVSHNSATIEQSGYRNSASQTQTGAYESNFASYNTALIEQGVGGYNAFNTATQTQSGYNNTAKIYQNGGDFNTATQTQTSHDDLAVISQGGNGNVATQTQH